MTSPTQFLKSSTFYFTVALILFALSVGYGVFQFRFLKAESTAHVYNKTQINVLEEAIINSKSQYKKLKDARIKQEQELGRKIESILPADENYLNLTQEFDDYFASRDKVGNPIFQSSLRFDKGSPVSDMNSVSVLPIFMNIESTRDNFFKFLDFVENSGSLENGMRLMGIKSIQLNFPEEGEIIKNPQQKINFTVEMNAYYQTAKIAR